jgi:zinc transporter ZupT
MIDYNTALGLLLLIGVVLATSMVSFFVSVSKKNLKLLLSFSAAFLLSVAFTVILPEVYEQHDSVRLYAFIILCGFFLQIILEFFSQGVEHGHIHVHQHKNKFSYLIPLSLSLYVHSFLEGLPLHGTNPLSNPIFWGIILHNIPVSFAFGTLLKGLLIKTWHSFVIIFVFSLATPLGWWAGGAIANLTLISNFEPIALSLSVGIFIHISTTIIFETGENHKYNFQKIFSILLGFGLGLLLSGH